jgi:hypothetical protein
VRRSSRFPKDQAEIVFNDIFVEYLEALTESERVDVLTEVVRLCANPAGTHPLSNRGRTDQLTGWNTVDVLRREHRVIFGSRVHDGVGVIEVLCAGPRKDDGVYSAAAALVAPGRLTDDEVTQIWQALALLDVVGESVELDGWDYRPPPAPDGMARAAVASGLLDEDTAATLSRDEIQAAMEHGWRKGKPDPGAALAAAMNRARAGVDVGDVTRTLVARRAQRCDALMPRAGVKCIRRSGHPGPHRSSP